MRRVFWFGAGVAAGVYGMVKVRRVAEAFTPDGIRDRVSAVGLGARMLRDEVAQGSADAESQLRERIAATPELHSESRSELDAEPTPEALERPEQPEPLLDQRTTRPTSRPTRHTQPTEKDL